LHFSSVILSQLLFLFYSFSSLFLCNSSSEILICHTLNLTLSM
jgi:hypothetical protein